MLSEANGGRCRSYGSTGVVKRNKQLAPNMGVLLMKKKRFSAEQIVVVPRNGGITFVIVPCNLRGTKRTTVHVQSLIEASLSHQLWECCAEVSTGGHNAHLRSPHHF